jgi:hypothetical protein
MPLVPAREAHRGGEQRGIGFIKLREQRHNAERLRRGIGQAGKARRSAIEAEEQWGIGHLLPLEASAFVHGGDAIAPDELAGFVARGKLGDAFGRGAKRVRPIESRS